MPKHYFLGIALTNRVKNALQLQKVLSDCACYIKTRLGLHEVSENLCAPSGIVLLEIYGGKPAVAEMETKLKKIPGLQVKKMVFDT
jgi:hypothetical protein